MSQPKSQEAEFDAFSNTYDQAINDAIAFAGLKVDFFARVKADYLLDLIGSHFESSKTVSVLDIGCGIGNYHPLLLDNVGDISGVDVSATSIKEASSRNPSARYDTYDGKRLPYPDHTFDVAFTVCVMHHVEPERWPTFVAEIRRVVKPGGLTVVFEHNPYNLLTRRIVSNCVFDKNAVLLAPRKTRSLLAQAGFSDIRTRHILAIPAANRFLRAIDLAIGRLPLGAQYFVKAVS